MNCITIRLVWIDKDHLYKSFINDKEIKIKIIQNVDNSRSDSRARNFSRNRNESRTRHAY